MLVAEPLGRRVYLCAFESAEGRKWLALSAEARPVDRRRLVREAVSLAALCEVAEESAGGGHLPELRARLAELRETEAPGGDRGGRGSGGGARRDPAAAPRIASGDYLDALGSASRRLEQALGETRALPSRRRCRGRSAGRGARGRRRGTTSCRSPNGRG